MSQRSCEWRFFSTPWLCAADVVGRTSLGMTRARESGPQMQDLPGHWWFSYFESGTVTEDSRSKGTQRLEQRGLWVARSTLTKIRTERAPDNDYDSVVHHLCGKGTWSHIRLELQEAENICYWSCTWISELKLLLAALESTEFGHKIWGSGTGSVHATDTGPRWLSSNQQPGLESCFPYSEILTWDSVFCGWVSSADNLAGAKSELSFVLPDLKLE